MKNVNRVIGRDGVERLYFRKAGFPSVPLKSPMPAPGQEAGSELEKEVAALLAAQPAKPAPSTLHAALRVYELDSADFGILAASTKKSYRGLMKELDEDFGDLHVSTFQPAYLLTLRNTWAKRGYRVPSLLLGVLRNALLPAIIEQKHFEGDPFAMIPGVRRPHDLGEAHVIWPEHVVLKVIEQAIAEGRYGIARGVAIGRYAGPRRGDIVKLTKGARRAGRFAFLSGKRKVPVNQPEDPALTAILDGTPAAESSLILAYNLSGLAYTESGFHQGVTDLVERLFKAGEIESDEYTSHGLRHTFGVEGALAGWTDAVGMSMMGHSSSSSFATYRRQADRIRMQDDGAALVAQLRERTSNGDLQNTLQKICKTEVVRKAKPRRRNPGGAR
jgi:integrase